jgi:4a-hydroxytetrahydrobiopterin dehydratase
MQFKFFKQIDNHLEAVFSFPDFKTAFKFMTELATIAEEINHHPEWKNIYNKVEIVLRTHDAGNVLTEKDFLLAERIEHIIQNYNLKNEDIL